MRIAAISNDKPISQDHAGRAGDSQVGDDQDGGGAWSADTICVLSGDIVWASAVLAVNNVKLDNAMNRTSISAEVLLMVRILAHAGMVK